MKKSEILEIYRNYSLIDKNIRYDIEVCLQIFEKCQMLS